MKIIHQSNALFVEKKEGSAVHYYIFPEYEIHYNDIKPGTKQVWHHHQNIHEVIFIISGELEAHWMDERGERQLQIVKVGDVIEVEQTPHTFVNASPESVKLIVFRFVPRHEDLREVIKNDKIEDSDLNG
jgi:uncharacterized RmlC-like cupin family protein